MTGLIKYLSKRLIGPLTVGIACMSAPVLAADTGHGGEAALPQLDPSSYPSQLFWLAVTFFVLLFLMWKVALPRVGETLARREKKISDDLRRAEELKDEAEKVNVALEETLAEARSHAQDILRKTQEDISAAQTKRLEVLEAEIGVRIQEAEQRIEEAQKAALADVQEVALETTTAIVEKLSDGIRMTPETVRQSLDQAAKAA